MASFAAIQCVRLAQVILGFKHLRLANVQHCSNAILQKSIWCGPDVSAKKTLHNSKSHFPERPKKPANVFIMYLQKMGPQIEKENPGVKRKDIVHQVSKMWHDVNPEEKSHLVMQRKEAFDKYKEDLRIFMDSVTPEQVIEEEKIKRLKLAQNLKKTRRALGIPRKPFGAYNCFVSEKFTERCDEPVPVYFKQIMNKWKSMSDSEKQKYLDKSKELKEKYAADILNWEKEMITMGRYDVIRKHTLQLLGKTDSRRKRSSKSSQSNEEADD